MKPEVVSIIEACLEDSLQGKISFGEVVGRLMAIGIERYHADYTRQECTYYSADGDSHVVSTSRVVHQVAEAFSATAVVAAVRQAQRSEIVYPEFVEKTSAAGCVGYFVQITGRCVQYFGRNGEIHTELFPSPK